MSYTVLARRYRSQSFNEVVGQEAIARTLENAIEQNRVAHAYLFVGTRGVGKTTMARLLAKRLNGGSEEVDRAIMAGHDTDVIEIDAASNRGVDEARDLIANCIYRPMRGDYKIYIIDEVHMLTREAFNALLKTMEEPPSHVKFILCTTEPHKVPPTIQSRCQRFDFRAISTDEIAHHLTHVVKAEQMQAEPEFVRAVARMAAGSMRDGLSLLDRVMAATPSGETIGIALLEKLLGLPEREVLRTLIDALARHNPREALETSASLLARGVSIEQTLESLVEHLRDLMVLAAAGSETELVDLVGPAREQAVELAQRFTPAGLIHMIALCENVGRMTKTSANPRALVEALIVRLAMTEQIADIAGLLRAGGGTALRAVAGGAGGQKKSDAPAVTRAAGRRPAGRVDHEKSESTGAAHQIPASAKPATATTDDVWLRVCEAAESKTMLRVLVQSLRLVKIHGDRAVLTGDDPRRLAYAQSKIELLGDLFKEALGVAMRIEFEDDDSSGAAPVSGAFVSDPVLEHDVIRKAISLFGAKVIAVENDEPAAGRNE